MAGGMGDPTDTITSMEQILREYHKRDIEINNNRGCHKY